MKRLAAEFLGTFALVFAGTGAIVIDDVSHGVVSCKRPDAAVRKRKEPADGG